VGERGWEIIHWLVEVSPKLEVQERRGKVVNMLIEMITEIDASKCGGRDWLKPVNDRSREVREGGRSRGGTKE
jgi:hypothetical protein